MSNGTTPNTQSPDFRTAKGAGSHPPWWPQAGGRAPPCRSATPSAKQQTEGRRPGTTRQSL